MKDSQRRAMFAKRNGFSEIYNLKKKLFHPTDWQEFKKAVSSTKCANSIQTGQTKSLFYIKVNSDCPVWKRVLDKGVKFDYVPSGNVKNVKWNSIMVKV